MGGITQSYYIIDLDSAPPLSFRSQPCWTVTLWFPKLHRLLASAFVHLASRISCKSEHFWMPVWSSGDVPLEFCGSAISCIPWLANPPPQWAGWCFRRLAARRPKWPFIREKLTLWKWLKWWDKGLKMNMIENAQNALGMRQVQYLADSFDVLHSNDDFARKLLHRLGF